jgi:hypothetical protein
MRFRSVVLPAAVALAAIVVVPSSASAATQCGLIVPSKVVINAEEVDAPMSLTSGCYSNAADHAYWDYDHPGSGAWFPVDFEASDLELGPDGWSLPWYDDDAMGQWVLTGNECKTGDGTDLTQNSAATLVKYASKVSAPVTRTSTKLVWAATATQWSGRSHKNVVRPGVTMGLFYQATGSTTWSYVKSATTSSTGKATISLSYPKSGNYRLKVAETPTVWAAYSSTIKGRV